MGFAKYAEDNNEIWEERMINRCNNTFHSSATMTVVSTRSNLTHISQGQPGLPPVSNKMTSRKNIIAVRV